MSKKEKNIEYLKKLKSHYVLRVKELELQELATRYRLKSVLPLSSRGLLPHHRSRSPLAQMPSEWDDSNCPCNADIVYNKLCSLRDEEKSSPTGTEEKSDLNRESNVSSSTRDCLDLATLTSINQMIKWEKDTKRRIARLNKVEEVILSSLTGKPPPSKDGQKAAGVERETPSNRYLDIKADVERMMEIVNHLASKVKEPGCLAQEDFPPVEVSCQPVCCNADLSSNLQGVVKFVNEKMPKIANSLASIEDMISKQGTQTVTTEDAIGGETICVEDSSEPTADREISKMETMKRNVDIVVNHLKVCDACPAEEFESIHHDLENILEIFHSVHDGSDAGNSTDAAPEEISKVVVNEQVESAMKMIDRIIARASHVVCETIIKEAEVPMLEMQQCLDEKEHSFNDEVFADTIEMDKELPELVDKSQQEHEMLESTTALDMFSCCSDSAVLATSTDFEQPKLREDLGSERTKEADEQSATAESLAFPARGQSVVTAQDPVEQIPSQPPTTEIVSAEVQSPSKGVSLNVIKSPVPKKSPAKEASSGHPLRAAGHLRNPVRTASTPIAVNKSKESRQVKGVSSFIAAKTSREEKPVKGLISPRAANTSREEKPVKGDTLLKAAETPRKESPVKDLTSLIAAITSKESTHVKGSTSSIVANTPKGRTQLKSVASSIGVKTLNEKSTVRGVTSLIPEKTSRKLSPAKGLISPRAENTLREKSPVKSVNLLNAAKTSRKNSPVKSVPSLKAPKKSTEESQVKDLKSSFAAKTSKERIPVKDGTTFIAENTKKWKTQVKIVASYIGVKTLDENSSVRGVTSLTPAKASRKENSMKSFTFCISANSSKEESPKKGFTSLISAETSREESTDLKSPITADISKEKTHVNGTISSIAANTPKGRTRVKSVASSIGVKTLNAKSPVRDVTSLIAAKKPREESTLNGVISHRAAKMAREKILEKTTASPTAVKPIKNKRGLNATLPMATDRHRSPEKASESSAMKPSGAKPSAGKRTSSPSSNKTFSQSINSKGSRSMASSTSSKKNRVETRGSKGDSGVEEHCELQKVGANSPLATNVRRMMRSQRSIYPPPREDCAYCRQASNRRESPSKGKGQNADEPAEG